MNIFLNKYYMIGVLIGIILITWFILIDIIRIKAIARYYCNVGEFDFVENILYQCRIVILIGK